MSDGVINPLQAFVSTAGLKEIEHWLAKYPSDQKQSAVMAALRIIQEENGYLSTEAMQSLAAYLEMPEIAVFEVVGFYTMYERQPVGRHVINVCTNISCQLCDCASIVRHLEKKLKIKCGETSSDNRFTLRAVECLGACVNAPMMQIDKTYHECLTPKTLDSILEEYQ